MPRGPFSYTAQWGRGLCFATRFTTMVMNETTTKIFPYLERLLDGEEVEWKTLGEVCKIKNGKDYKHLSSGSVPVYGSGGVMKYVNEAIYSQPSVLIPRKGSLNNLFFVDTPFWNVDTIYYTEINTDYILPKFFYYYLITLELEKLNLAGGVPSLTQSTLNKLSIPIPPLRVQARIVEILDKFTQLETQLEAELQAELEARRKQYAYYRDQLLNFSQCPPLNVNIEWRTLGEVCHIVGRIGFRGYTRNDIVERGEGAISISPTNIVNQNLNLSAEKNTYISWEKYNESPEIMIRIGDIVLAKTASVGKAALVRELKEKATINPQMVVLKEISCLPAYLVYYICTPNFQLRLKSLSGQGSVPNISQAKLKTIPIPIPPLSEQRRIVDILDRFDTLTNSISEGLPKEIALRRKQYAYYRDALLSFPRPEVSA